MESKLNIDYLVNLIKSKNISSFKISVFIISIKFIKSITINFYSHFLLTNINQFLHKYPLRNNNFNFYIYHT